MTADPYARIADLYDEVPEYQTRRDVGFFVRQAQRLGGPVLELGCGTGRVLIPSARAGIEIVGLDASPRMLEICRARIAQEPVETRSRAAVVEGDMRSFDLGRQFMLVTLPFRPFQHLVTVPDQLACLASIRRHLRPGGRVIIDLFNPSLEALVQNDEGRETGEDAEFLTPDGRRVLRRYRFVTRDRAAQVNAVEIIYYVTHPDGRQERLVHGFHFRYFFRFEAEHLLARAGFEVEAVWGDYDESAFGRRNPGELILLART